MSFLKLIKLAREFEAKLKRESQPLRYFTGPGQYMDIDPSKVQLPPEKTEHEKLLEQVPPPPPLESLTPPPAPQQQPVSKPKPTPNANVKAVQDYLNREVAGGRLSAAPINFPNGYWTNETVNALKNWATQNKAKGNLNSIFSTVLSLSKLPAQQNQVQQMKNEVLQNEEPLAEYEEAVRRL